MTTGNVYVKFAKRQPLWRTTIDTDVIPDAQPPTRRSGRAAGLGTLGLLAYCTVNALTRVGGNTGDFPAFYNAARAMLDGNDIYKTGFPDYIYPPLLAFLYTPFALLTPDAAAVAMLGFILLVFATALLLGSQTLLERQGLPVTGAALWPVCFFALLLSLDKVRGEFQMWQTNSLLLLLFVLALRWLDRRPARAGAALALAFHIKYLPILFLPYLLLRRRWIAAAAFLTAIPLLALLPALLIGWDTNLRYVTLAFRGLFRLIGLDIGAADAASIDPFLRSPISLSITSALARWLGPDLPNRVAYGLALALGLLVAGVAWHLYRRAGVPFLYRPDGGSPPPRRLQPVVALEWIALLVVLLIFSPQSNSRHFSMLVLVNVLAVVCLRHPRSATARWPLLVGVAVFFLGSILPTGDPVTSLGRRVWIETSGISWCALLLLVALLGFVTEEARVSETRMPMEPSETDAAGSHQASPRAA